MPVVYIPHGGGPWPFVDVGFGDKDELDRLAGYLRREARIKGCRDRRRQVLCVSAHRAEADAHGS